MPSALVCVVDGFEPIECITVVDVLRRGGVSVTLAGTEKMQAGAHGVTVCMDALVSEVNSTLYDAIILPGGPGWKEMQRNDTIKALTEKQASMESGSCQYARLPLLVWHSGVSSRASAQHAIRPLKMGWSQVALSSLMSLS